VELLAALLGLAVQGLVVGTLARLAIPGPDPMPWWLTLGIGLVGAFLGGGIGYGRGITGPDAQRPPTRGFGIRRRRL
jgi:uncharacterized membrane protein YeaQ/YmgE (transglycosylase-associated protein family)